MVSREGPRRLLIQQPFRETIEHMTEGTVLHADLDSFFASVEQRDDPSLRGRPVIVGGGVVLACSYEAKAKGVRTAMGGRQALRLCPDAVVVSPRMDAYTPGQPRRLRRLPRHHPLVEGISIDEAFLEVGGLRRIRGAPSTIAAAAPRRRARARSACRSRSASPAPSTSPRSSSALCKPDGLLVVPIEDELRFLHALPVERLWGVGPVTSEKLHAVRLHTVGQVAALELRELVPADRARQRRATCTPSPTTATRAGSRPDDAGARSARSTPSAAARTPPPTSTACCSASSTASPGACGRPSVRAAPSRCGCGSTTSPAPPCRTRCRGRP